MNPYKNELPEWLQKLQNESWQVEVALSAVIVFALFQLFEPVNVWESHIQREVLSFSLSGIGAVIKTAIAWLIIGFTFHLILRSIWVGLIGLSYTFKGINHERLNLASPFKEFIEKQVTLTSSILYLERWCSATFAIAFLFFLAVLGVVLYIIVFLVLPIFIAQNFVSPETLINSVRTYQQIWQIVSLLFLIDFISLGLLKRIKWFSKIYYPIYRLVNFFTLAFLYRNIYYTLVSNVSRWKLFLGLLAYVGLSMVFFQYFVSGRLNNMDLVPKTDAFIVDKEQYANLATGKMAYAQIQSDVIKENYLRIFVLHFRALEDSVHQECDYEERVKLIEEKEFDQKRAKRQAKDEVIMDCYKQFYHLQLDTQLYTNIDWLFHERQDNKHKGILTWLDIGHLENGRHELKVMLNLKNDTLDISNYATIPFFLSRRAIN